MARSWLERINFAAMLLLAIVPLTSVSFTDNMLRLTLLTMLIGLCTKQTEAALLKNCIIISALPYWFILILSTGFNPEISNGLNLTWQRIFEILPFITLSLWHGRKKDALLLMHVYLGAMLIADAYYIWQFCAHSFIVNGSIVNRPSGFYWQDWFMQIFLLLAIVISLIRLDYCKSAVRVEKLLYASVLLLSTVAAVMSFARGVWLTAAVFFLGYALFRLRSRKKLLAAGLILCVGSIYLGVMVSPGFKSRIDTLTDMNFVSNAHRVMAWQSSWKMFKDNPLLGVGQGNWQKNYLEKYIDPNESERLPNAHNNYMQFIAETGALGLAAYLALVFSVLFTAIRRFKQATDEEERAGALVMFFAMFTYLFIGLMGDFKDTRTLSEALWLVIGAGYVLSAREEGRGVKKCIN